jgi:hypothetical protein
MDGNVDVDVDVDVDALVLVKEIMVDFMAGQRGLDRQNY